jgi:hypothetical protein
MFSYFMYLGPCTCGKNCPRCASKEPLIHHKMRLASAQLQVIIVLNKALITVGKLLAVFQLNM